MLKTKINIDIYSTSLLFIVTDDIYESALTYVKHIKEKEDWSREYAASLQGVSIYGSNPDYSVLIKYSSLTYNTIVHELFHIARTLTSRIGVEDDEATAWLLGYLAEKVFKFLEDKKIKIEHG